MHFPREVISCNSDCKNFLPSKSNGESRASARQVDDYNSVRFEGERWAAHRLSYHLNKGEIPRKPRSRSSGLVLHTCDNKWCINPDHLYLGTASQNAIDNSKRNKAWLDKRSKIQSKLGFPKVSEEGRKSMADLNSKRLKKDWSENKQKMLEQRGIL